MPQENLLQTIPDLLGGWMPRAWFGDGEEPKPRRTRRAKPASFAGLKKRDPRLRRFRRRYYEMVAIIAADVKAKRPSGLPFSIEREERLEGETYFLTICQTLYREMACKQVLCEPMRGEDLISKLVYWWSQGPLASENLRCAMRGTSLDLGEEEDESD